MGGLGYNWSPVPHYGAEILPSHDLTSDDKMLLLYLFGVLEALLVEAVDSLDHTSPVAL